MKFCPGVVPQCPTTSGFTCESFSGSLSTDWSYKIDLAYRKVVCGTPITRHLMKLIGRQWHLVRSSFPVPMAIFSVAPLFTFITMFLSDTCFLFTATLVFIADRCTSDTYAHETALPVSLQRGCILASRFIDPVSLCDCNVDEVRSHNPRVTRDSSVYCGDFLMVSRERSQRLSIVPTNALDPFGEMSTLFPGHQFRVSTTT